MISLLTEEKKDAFLHFCSRKPVGTRIAANLISYGLNFDFARFWMQAEGKDITSAISRVDGNMAVEASGDSNYDELEEFIRVVGQTDLLCTPDVFRRLGRTPFSNTMVLEHISKSKSQEYFGDCEKAPGLSKVWALLRDHEEFRIHLQSYEAWYADMSHRIRHDTARAYLIPETAVALTCAETPDSAIISGVAVKKRLRGRGIGGRLVGCLTEDLEREGKKVFLFCEDRLAGFYRQIGFQQICHGLYENVEPYSKKT